MQPPATHFPSLEYLHTGVTVGAGVGGLVTADNSNRDACSYSPASEPDVVTWQ